MVTVLLRRGGTTPLPSMEGLGRLPLRRRSFLGREEYARRSGAAPGDVEAVRRFATGHGLSVDRVEPARRAATLSGTAERFSKAFGVRLLRATGDGRAPRVADRPASIPPDLSSVVRGVFGLDSRPLLRPHFRLNQNPGATGYSIPTVGAAYQFPPGQNGSGTTIGLLEFGGGFSVSDLTQYFSGLGLSVPEVVSVGIDGATNAPTGDPSGPDAEVELDVEMAGALAPGARIVVYFAPNTEQGFADAVTTAIHDSANHPEILSISWGGPEPTWSAQGRTALEDAAQDGAEMGVTIFAASGDQGASDGEPTGTLAVDFPASSPYVVGCGGTRLGLSGTAITSEVVWNDLAEGNGATGGGVSEEFALPSFQSAARVPPAPNGFAGRGVPDVAADADPETGYAVFIDGAPAVIGGTSAASPLWAALAARLTQALGKPLGYLNPLLYSPGLTKGFRDVTRGNNGGYSAGPGWDPCTGLGSPEGTPLLQQLEADE